jgi:hypothetical protein
MRLADESIKGYARSIRSQYKMHCGEAILLRR